MYTCINCGAHVEDLYRRYSPSVLKVLKCDNCGELADKYIEYDPVIVLVDLVLLEKPAYRHLLYNSDFNSYWKLLIVLILGDSFRKWSSYDSKFHLANANSTIAGSGENSTLDSMSDLVDKSNNVFIFQGERIFYFLLVHTAVTIGTFIGVVVLVTELRWILWAKKPPRYKSLNLVKGLIIGGSAKLLGLLGIVWQHIAPEPHQILIYGYTILSLLTAYCSVVCESGRTGSFIGLISGLLAHNYVYNLIPELYLSTANMTLLQR